MTQAIENRYTELASAKCCLSCGTAVGHADPKPGEVCVDLGSGRGTDVLRLADAVGPTGHAYGLDVTPAMLDKSRKTAAKLGVTNATFVHSKLEELALANDTADWVVSNCVLNHAEDKARVWREIARVLKPGGRFVVSDIYAVGEISEADRKDPDAVAECWAGAVSKAEYLLHILEAGLADVSIVEESAAYEKGRTSVASFTVTGRRPSRTCCCCE